MDNELEVIRDEMEHTRANLADKLGALETQVRETVVGAKEAVSSTVEGMKEVVGSVSETVGSVAETFDISKQVERHPWIAMGAAVAAGFVAAQVLDRMGGQPSTPAPTPPQSYSDLPLTSTRFGSEPVVEAEKKDGGLLGSMTPALEGAMGTLLQSAGSLAVNSVMGMIRELVVRGLSPEWKGEVTKLVDQVADQLGGRPLDETRSEQLLGALGLGEKKEGVQQEAPLEGAPYDPARQQQQPPAGTVKAANGPRGRGGKFTSL